MAAPEKKIKKKKKLGSYPLFSVVFSIFITLLVVGVFGYFVINANELKRYIRENVELQVYLKKNVSENDLTRMSKTLSSKDYTLFKDQIPQVRTITKQEAADQFIADTGEDFVKFLGENPLRDVVVIKIKEAYHHQDSLANIEREISQQSTVFEIAYRPNLVKSINDNLAVISILLIGFSSILLLAAVILINNTIKLALFSQRFLIRSMQLVGATASFIQRPFLNRALFYGLIAGVLASGILIIGIYYLTENIADLKEIQNYNNLYILFAGIILLGLVVGFGSSYRAVRKYMKMSLDELY